MFLKYLTITGADENSDISKMLDLSIRFPFVEWGILMSESKQGTDRYPLMYGKWIVEFRKYVLQKYLNASFHLCGKICRDFVNNKFDIYNFLPMDPDMSRCQLNFNSVNSEFDEKVFIKAIDRFPLTNFIIPYNYSNRDLWKILLKTKKLNYQVLFDSSGGRGKEVIDFPEPLTGLFCGWAGGLGPENIEKTLNKFYERINRGVYWLDMESNVRTDGKLDFDKVEFVLQKAEDFVI